MTYTIFRTNTLLDMRAITVMGLNAKPNSKSPIGYFGTGLKMAIATLLRNNIPVRIYVGPREYEFKKVPSTFRGTGYDQIILGRKRSLLPRWDDIKLPFTTQLAKNWELWQAYRELEANTRDEGGTTEIKTDASYEVGEPGVTKILVVDYDFSHIAHQDMTTEEPVFMRHVGEPILTGNVDVYKGVSKYLYYKGMRVMTLPKSSQFTYNLTSAQVLTEDRTLKDQWYIPYQLCDAIGNSEDKDFIDMFLNASENRWESEWPWDQVTFIPGEAFMEVMKDKETKQQAYKVVAPSTTEHFPIWQTSRLTTAYKRQVTLSMPNGELLSTRFNTWVKEWQDKFEEEDLTLLNEVQNVLLKDREL